MYPRIFLRQISSVLGGSLFNIYIFAFVGKTSVFRYYKYVLLTLSIGLVQVIIRHPKRRQKVHNNGVFPNFKNTGPAGPKPLNNYSLSCTVQEITCVV
jgi:hypothetical protein